MNIPQTSGQVFPFRMAPWLPGCYRTYLLWLRGLLERLGYECTLAIWQGACQEAEDVCLRQILSTGWQSEAPAEGGEPEKSLAALVVQFFPVAAEGVTPEQARALVERMPPIQQIRQMLPSLNLWKETTASEALHLRLHGLARLCEALIHQHGKQGELIAYDLLRQGRILAGSGQTGSVADFMADFIAEPEEPNLFTVGLKTELVRASDCEAVLLVRECAWASYFQQHHPAVGYLVACSTDEAAYRAFNPSLRLQRTTTLMEGGEVCDFRIYNIDPP